VVLKPAAGHGLVFSLLSQHVDYDYNEVSTPVRRPSPLQKAADMAREGCGMSASCSPLPVSPCIVTVRPTISAYYKANHTSP
jgi:hypothetical protein